MSRSRRRPYAAVTGVLSAKEDKRLARRGVRRKQNLALRMTLDHDILLLPHRLECACNDVWCWRRDGRQRDFSRWRYSADESRRRYYEKLTRK